MRFYRSRLPDALCGSMDIWLCALRSGSIAVVDLTPSIQTNIKFWQSLVSVWPQNWSPIPSETSRTAQLTWLLEHIPTVAAVEEMFDLVPTSCFDRDFWLKIVQSASFAWSPNEFLKMAPDFVWHDKDIIVPSVSSFAIVAQGQSLVGGS
jgi:hypothetical protein